jgi:hypothetical protein
MSNFFRGVSAEQDGRYKKADEVMRAKLTKEGKFAPILETKVSSSCTIEIPWLAFDIIYYIPYYRLTGAR